MADVPAVRFIPSTSKIVEALTWLAKMQPGITVFYACKILFLADRAHLRAYGRPILGDRYIAMADGPVPSVVYYVAKHDGHHLDTETLAHVDDAIKYDLSGRYPSLWAKREPDMKSFSRTDLSTLNDALSRYSSLSFDELWKLVHDDAAYKAAWSDDQPNRDMSYELLLDPKDPHFTDQIRDLRENAPYLTF